MDGDTSARSQLLAARDARNQSDYIFEPWTAFGWLVLSIGTYIWYIYFRLVQRMREHNRRRLDLLVAANELAWERAVAQGREEELRSRFERVAGDLAVLRQMTSDFRDPWVWFVIILFGQTIAVLVVNWLLDVDLMKHTAAEADAEWQLTEIFSALGVALHSAPAAPPPKSPHNYAGRIVAVIFTCGLYGYWWMYDLMRDANDHFRRDWMWEDAVVAAVW